MLPVEFYFSLFEDIDVIGRGNIRIEEGEVGEWELVELNTRTRMVKII